MTGGRCSEVDLELKLLGRDFEWSLWTSGRYSEVVFNPGLTIYIFNFCYLQVYQVLNSGIFASLMAISKLPIIFVIIGSFSFDKFQTRLDKELSKNYVFRMAL